jgi:hypothetical protein
MNTTASLKERLDSELKKSGTLTLELSFPPGTLAWDQMNVAEALAHSAGTHGEVRAMLNYGGQPYTVEVKS